MRWRLDSPDAKEQISMAVRSRNSKREIEKDHPSEQLVAKLRRSADTIESGKRFGVQIAGERVSIPPDATINLEHERGRSEEEIEFQLKWSRDD
jgi:amphi-Trp domain-containing protein